MSPSKLYEQAEEIAQAFFSRLQSKAFVPYEAVDRDSPPPGQYFVIASERTILPEGKPIEVSWFTVNWNSWWHALASRSALVVDR